MRGHPGMGANRHYESSTEAACVKSDRLLGRSTVLSPRIVTGMRLWTRAVTSKLAADVATDGLVPERSANGENQLSPQMTGFADTMSFGGICETVTRYGRRRDRADVQQCHNPLQVRAITGNSRAQYPDIRARLTKSIWCWCDPDQPSTRL
jgi:hypothetical protein